MLCVAGSLRVAAVACLVISGVVLMSPSALADSSASGGSVIITAVIAPVRMIIVNDQGTILEILSNGPDDVTPSVYKNQPNGNPIALTPTIYDQYAAIIKHTDLHKTGVVYTSTDNKSTGWQRWMSLSSYQSILPKTIDAFLISNPIRGQRTGRIN